VGRDSLVGTATRYGLDGSGIESRWGRGFPRLSRTALEPTQLPLQWVPGFYPGGKAEGAEGFMVSVRMNSILSFHLLCIYKVIGLAGILC
jgi:hypothetical protein